MILMLIALIVFFCLCLLPFETSRETPSAGQITTTELFKKERRGKKKVYRLSKKTARAIEWW